MHKQGVKIFLLVQAMFKLYGDHDDNHLLHNE